MIFRDVEDVVPYNNNLKFVLQNRIYQDVKALLVGCDACDTPLNTAEYRHVVNVVPYKTESDVYVGDDVLDVPSEMCKMSGR